jgi:hypothetical protein
MSRKPTATPATTSPAPVGKSATTYLFSRTKQERRNELTHEQIEDHLAAFARIGGKIEVLGTTFTFKAIGHSAKPKDAAATAETPLLRVPQQAKLKFEEISHQSGVVRYETLNRTQRHRLRQRCKSQRCCGTGMCRSRINHASD